MSGPLNPITDALMVNLYRNTNELEWLRGHIANLENDRAELIETLREILDDEMSDCRKSLAERARNLLVKLGAKK